jgi:hypothetical protein
MFERPERGVRGGKRRSPGSVSGGRSGRGGLRGEREVRRRYLSDHGSTR